MRRRRTLDPGLVLATSIASLLVSLIAACALKSPLGVEQHRWWTGLGPVLPHDTFPTDCKLCHVGLTWGKLVDTFEFDHRRETGVPLKGAHEYAQCIRCHNDRGHVSVFAAKGCVGCHEDVHLGDLGDDCASCHTEVTWRPYGQLEAHGATRFPLTGIHAQTACNRCHVGVEVGSILPVDPECVNCHADDLARTTNHIGLGWVARCDRCHIPTFWFQAEVD